MNKRCWLAALTLFIKVSFATTPVIEFESTITPPIWTPALSNGGIGGQILALLSKAAGVQYKINYLPVRRFQQSSAIYRVGDPDILTVQKPYIVLPIMVFRSAFFFYQPHHKWIEVRTLQDLKGHILGVLRGTVVDKNAFTVQGIQIEESDSIESLLRKLKKGRIDVCILVRISALHTIKQLFPQEQDDFASVTIARTERPVALIIDQDSAEGKLIAARYRKVLPEILHSPQYYAILESFYGKNNVPDDWFKRMAKFERIYAVETE